MSSPPLNSKDSVPFASASIASLLSDDVASSIEILYDRRVRETSAVLREIRRSWEHHRLVNHYLSDVRDVIDGEQLRLKQAADHKVREMKVALDSYLSMFVDRVKSAAAQRIEKILLDRRRVSDKLAVLTHCMQRIEERFAVPSKLEFVQDCRAFLDSIEGLVGDDIEMPSHGSSLGITLDDIESLRLARQPIAQLKVEKVSEDTDLMNLELSLREPFREEVKLKRVDKVEERFFPPQPASSSESKKDRVIGELITSYRELEALYNSARTNRVEPSSAGVIGAMLRRPTSTYRQKATEQEMSQALADKIQQLDSVLSTQHDLPGNGRLPSRQLRVRIPSNGDQIIQVESSINASQLELTLASRLGLTAELSADYGLFVHTPAHGVISLDGDDRIYYALGLYGWDASTLEYKRAIE